MILLKLASYTPINAAVAPDERATRWPFAVLASCEFTILVLAEYEYAHQSGAVNFELIILDVLPKFVRRVVLLPVVAVEFLKFRTQLFST